MNPSQLPDNAFSKIIGLIQAKNPLQKKMIENVLSKRDDLFWQRINFFSGGFEKLLQEKKISYEKIADCYIKLCKDMLIEQIKFKKTGKYSSTSFAEVAARVYHSQDEMEAMIYGLAISQFLWINHYGLFDYFIKTINSLNGINHYLEIGPGHGLHLVESIKAFKKAQFDVVDISSFSLEVSQNILTHFVPKAEVKFHQQDVCKFTGAAYYDLVVINEVLEHLEDPLPILKKISELIGNNGHVFLTTCANAPSIDHIFLYDSVEAIREQIGTAGLEIVSEKVLAVEPNVDPSIWKEKKMEINYGALCRKKRS